METGRHKGLAKSAFLAKIAALNPTNTDDERMSDILQEIDDAMKREKAEKFWKENGPTLVASAIALVVFTGIFSAWNAWKLNVNTKQTDLLVGALETQYPETALDAAAENLKGGHQSIAMLHNASIKAGASKTAEAIALYRDIAKDVSTPSLWRELATLNAVKLEWADSENNADKAKALIADLKPLMNERKPWAKLAAIQAAMITADGLQDYTLASRYLAPVLNDEKTPATLKDRATALDHIYVIKADEKKTEAAPDVKAEPKG